MFAKPADSDAGSPPPDLAAIPEPPVVVLPVPKPAARKPTPDPRITKVSATTPDWRAANRSDEADAVSRSMNEANAIQVAASAVGPMAPEGSVPSRWDALNAAVSRCSREGFIAGIVCSERARMQYCEGYWGAVPQCRGASSPDASR
jgi:hypothetical protein